MEEAATRCYAALVVAGGDRCATAEAYALLDAHIASARAAFPTFDVEPERFAAHIGSKVRDRPEALSTLHAASLYLTLACGLGRTKAIAAFRQRFAPDIDRALAKATSTGAPLDELQQKVEVKLFAASKRGPPHILKYSGHGALQGWVRVVVARLVIDLRRSHAVREVPVAPLSPTEIASRGLPPELQVAQARHRDDVQAAIESALEDLSPKERRLLRGALVQRLSTDDIGGLFGVHRTTAARWVDNARRRLAARAHAHLRDRLGAREDSVQGLVALVRSQLDLSVERLLASQGQ